MNAFAIFRPALSNLADTHCYYDWPRFAQDRRNLAHSALPPAALPIAIALFSDICYFTPIAH